MLRRNLIQKTMLYVVMAGGILAISGCGFKLAGNYDLSEYYPQLALETKAKYRDFNEAFIKHLERAGVSIVDENTKGVPRLNIEKYDLTNKAANADARGIAQSFTLSGQVTYEITFVGQVTEDYIAKEGEEVKHSSERTLTASRFVDVNSEEQLEGSREADQKEEEIIEELAGNLLRALVFKRDKISAYQ